MCWGLGFINVFVTLGVVATGLGLLVSTLFPEFGAGLMDGLTGREKRDMALAVSERITLMAAFVATVSTWWVINRLRRIFLAVNQGDAFEPANVNRLRAMGLGLMGVQIAAAILTFSAPLAEGRADRDYDINLGAWLGILIVFMLAEVFRQGAAMRDDAQMTV